MQNANYVALIKTHGEVPFVSLSNQPFPFVNRRNKKEITGKKKKIHINS